MLIKTEKQEVLNFDKLKGSKCSKIYLRDYFKLSHNTVSAQIHTRRATLNAGAGAGAAFLSKRNIGPRQARSRARNDYSKARMGKNSFFLRYTVC